jgi:hypothetical protein
MKINIKHLLFLFLFGISTFNLFAQIIITKSATQPTCNNINGAVSVFVTGGLPPYTYEWKYESNNGQIIGNGASISNVSPGLYSIKVTDVNQDYASDTININNGINGYIRTTSNALCPNKNGVVEAFITGGLEPYSYNWSNGATTKVVSNLAGGTDIQVEIIDANGCNAYSISYGNNVKASQNTIFETTVGETSLLSSSYTSIPEQCPLQNGSISITASGGVAPYSYLWNTIPVKSTSIVTGLTNGYYNVTIIDALGCKMQTGVYVEKNAGALNASAVKTNDYCSKKQGKVNLTITGGLPPYVVNWPDGSSAISRTGLEGGLYNVTIRDQNNCVFNLQIVIEDLSPVFSSVSVNETNCDNISGSAQVQATNGTAPYTYQWNTGASSTNLSSLPYGYYSVLVKDADGCKSSAWGFVNIKSSCYATVSGKIYQDNNGNCLQEAGEYPILNQLANMSRTLNTNYLFDGYNYTNMNGQFSMRYVLPDNYLVNYYSDIAGRKTLCPASGKYNLSIPTSGVNYVNNDFAMVPSSLFEDVTFAYKYCNPTTPPRPGFNYSYSVPYKNNGTLPSNGFIELVYGNLETFVTSFPLPDYYDAVNKTLRFNYSNLMLGDINNITLTFNLPKTTLLGSTYNHLLTAHIGGTDPTPENNIESIPFTVVGSFDPNDLRVFPDGLITEKDEELSYFIRFQNTGTYRAELVIIKDIIDQSLDITSISDITASHEFKFTVGENSKVQFAFENINLPDKKRDEPGSHGFVNFKIRKNKNLPLGTEIKNTANIYFDYNEAIITNTTVNTIGISTDVLNQKTIISGLVYPNPAKDHSTFRFEEKIVSIQLISITGKQVLNEKIDSENTFDVQLNVAKGMYLYKAISADGNTYSGKLVIE